MFVNNRFKPTDLVMLGIDPEQSVGMVLTYEVGMHDYITYNVRWSNGTVGNYDAEELVLRGTRNNDFINDL